MRTQKALLWAVAISILLALLPVFGVGGYILGLLTSAFYLAVFAMGWDLLFGFAGEVNFGPSFLIGVGAYTAGLLNHYEHWPIIACVPAGALAAIVGGLLLALPALKLSGPYFGLITLVAVLLLQNIVVIFAGVTGGEIGLDLPDVLSISASVNYWYALGLMVVVGLALFALSRSAVGLILQASGQDAVEAAALGFNVVRHKLAAFCISALVSGVAGAMLVFYLGTVSTDSVVDLAIDVNVIIAAVLGGRRTILGSVVGATFLIVAGELLRPVGELSNFIVSAIALVVILFYPAGILGRLIVREGA